MTVFEEAKQSYNRIMNFCGLEFLTIGESLSEDTEGWTIRDMVSECQYQLDCCYEEGNANADGRSISQYKSMYGCDDFDAIDAHAGWLAKTTSLRNFIRKYRKEALKEKCHIGHCSKFD